MRLPVVASAFPHSIFWRVIGFNTEHVEWQGCSLHDLIQPAFSFLVGAALAVFHCQPAKQRDKPSDRCSGMHSAAPSS